MTYQQIMDHSFSLTEKVKHLSTQRESLINKLTELHNEQTTLDETLKTLTAIKSTMAADNLNTVLSVVNSVMASVFDTTDIVEFDHEAKDFFVVSGDKVTSLSKDNGGGYNSVVSLIFVVFIIMKSKGRRFITLDEQFTVLSDQALTNFVAMLRTLCSKFGFDILFVTHDSRIENQMVDASYILSNGSVTQVK